MAEATDPQLATSGEDARASPGMPCRGIAYVARLEPELGALLIVDQSRSALAVAGKGVEEQRPTCGAYPDRAARGVVIPAVR